MYAPIVMILWQLFSTDETFLKVLLAPMTDSDSQNHQLISATHVCSYRMQIALMYSLKLTKLMPIWAHSIDLEFYEAFCIVLQTINQPTISGKLTAYEMYELEIEVE